MRAFNILLLSRWTWIQSSWQNKFFTDCFKNPVGVADPKIIPDDRITSSSNQDGLFRAAYGRLNGYRGCGWCSGKPDSDSEWLQVDIGEIIQACGVAIQGKRTRHQRVKAFTLSYSLDESNWETYRDESGEEMVRIPL